jgi:YesN/AraC family two-component response regulator
LSGHKDFEYVRQALLYGAKDYILKPTQYEQLREVFSKLKTELDAEMISSGHEVETKGNTFSQKVVEIIKNYVEEHYKDVRLDELAQLVQMNPFYLSKFFKEKTGQNFSDYLIQIKMEKAAQFLQDIRYKTYEVSYMVGYSEPKSFTRTFKRFYGISPREFRRSET